MYLADELFKLQHDGKTVLYAPLAPAIALVNNDMKERVEMLKAGQLDGSEPEFAQLRKVGIITEQEPPKYVSPQSDGFAPIGVTLVPGYACPLRCVYCYSEGGEKAGKPMDIAMAKKAIDMVVANAGTNDCYLAFHGGGEPFMDPPHMSLVKEATRYFKEKAVKPHTGGVSNGMFSDETLEWIVENLKGLDISIDGPAFIQNAQRPRAGGGESYDTVMKNIRKLEKAGYKYGLRATVTAQSVDKMTEMVDFFASISSTERFHFEPCFACGRADASNAPDSVVFAQEYIRASDRAHTLGRKLFYSCATTQNVYDIFCSSVRGEMVVLLPDGNVTACIEVCKDHDPRADVFFIGKYDGDRFVFFEDRIRNLRQRTVDKMNGCADCFAKYHCCGDCPAKVLAATGNMLDSTRNNGCRMHRPILQHEIIRKLGGGDK